MRAYGFILLILFGGQGCGQSHMACPIYMDVVYENDPKTHTKVAAAFEGWVTDAIYKPGSAFTVWTSGPDRNSYNQVLLIGIPAFWGEGVLEKKASFLRATREQIDNLNTFGQKGTILPDGFVPPDTASVRTLVVFSPGLPAVVGQNLSESATAGHAKIESFHASVVVDLSNSMAVSPQSDLMRAFDGWLVDGLITPGATFTVYLAGNSYDTARRIYSVTVPELPPAPRTAALLGARNELSHILTSFTGDNASAIAEAIAVAVSELREHRGRYCLFLLSDLRQFNPSVWNFEGSIPSGENYIKWLRREALFVDLHDIPVVACGLHNHRGRGAGAYDARLAAELRQTWEVALKSMGAPKVKMFTTFPETPFTP